MHFTVSKPYTCCISNEHLRSSAPYNKLGIKVQKSGTLLNDRN